MQLAAPKAGSGPVTGEAGHLRPGSGPVTGEAGHPSLGIGTQLDHQFESLLNVRVSLFPSSGEAALIYSPKAMGCPSNVDPDTGELFPTKWELLDQDDKDARNGRRSATRSKGRMRRYMVHNRLTKMWVLTLGEGLHGEDGYRELQQRLRDFIRRLRRSLFRGKDFPYLFSIEQHPDGHGWHVNMMLQNVFLDKHQVQRIWGHGNVWYTDFTSDKRDWIGRPIGGRARSGARAGARRAASYAAKYIGKDFDDPDVATPYRAHRYEVAQGFQPTELVRRFSSFNDALQSVLEHPAFGKCIWHARSDDWEDWDGPPCQVIFFDPPDRPVKDRQRRPRVATEGRPLRAGPLP